jgi:hypothetical protein
MSQEINQESKRQFLSTIERAMTLLHHVGHITDYNDLSDEDHIQINAIYGALFSFSDNDITSDDWINAGIPVGEIEKGRLYFDWYHRLHVAGIYDHEGRAICAECLPEDLWKYVLPLQEPEKKKFRLISRTNVRESFFCEECKQVIKILYP